MGGAIYAIAGGKGGVGRTTVALNLGVALQREGYNTALVDADVAMTDLDSHVEVDADAGVHDVLAGSASINDAVVDGPEGLSIVPGDPSLHAFAAADDEKLYRVLEPMKAAHEVVLVDTGPGLETVHREAFHAADGVVLVTTPTEGAVAGAAKTKAVVDHVDADIVGVAVSRADRSQVRPVAERLDVDPLAAIPDSAAVASDGVVVGDDSSAAGAAFERLGTAVAVYTEAGSVESVAGDVAVPGAQAADAAQAANAVDPATTDRSEAGESGLGQHSGVARRLRDRIRGDDGDAIGRVSSEGQDDEDVEENAEGEETEQVEQSAERPAGDPSDGDPLGVLFTDEYGSRGGDSSGRRWRPGFGGLRGRLGGLGPRRLVGRLGRGSRRNATGAGDESPIPDDEDPLEYLLTKDR